MTHGLAVRGTGGTAALATTQIGSDITLPAGGPWIIHGVWAQVAKVTTIPDQGTGGDLIVSAVSGDLEPDPAPGTYPLIGAPGNPSANEGIAAVPLNIWETNWTAAGKAVIRLNYRQQLAISTASALAAGIIFSDAIPERRPLRFVDVVRGSFASATEQSLGTITVAEKATRIVGLLADLNKGDAVTAAEAIMATIRLDSDDIKLPPAQFPCNRAFDAADGTPVGPSGVAQSQFIPLDIPVVGGSRINVFAITTQSVTGNADLNVYLAYE